MSNSAATARDDIPVAAGDERGSREGIRHPNKIRVATPVVTSRAPSPKLGVHSAGVRSGV
ncbi:hypothetical protein Apa02nite_063730 [Actinoplanes palleronii]|uniref:Uncharacterized protein n=1 Tax=Actinoplanes palleronii TaxID=113570 RepID=A0ABQ4BHW3_9ACTN|nr:hypothetical protein Apa02nite_063730 [Actinoplanes palleronii]